MIELKNIKISVDDKEIIKWLDYKFEEWKTYFLLWKNWSWKSSLALAISGHPKYKMSWELLISWINFSDSKPEDRAREWIFLSFQNVPEIKWVKLLEYLRIIYNNHLKIVNPETRPLSPFLFKRFLKKYIDELSINETFLDRDLNVGFSWWEKRKIEILQMKLLDPKYIILDEIDSWLDIEAFRLVGEFIKQFHGNKCIIIITHRFEMLDFITPDNVVVLQSWEIKEDWWIEIIEKIKNEGF